MSAAPLRENGTGWYLYGVVAAGSEPPRATAIDPEHEVVTLAEGGVAGLASQVSLDEFDETSLSEHLGNTAWLEEKIRAHEVVLEAVLPNTPVIPCRFCTVYRDEDDLRRFLAEQGAALAEVLAGLSGRVELGVKAFLESPAERRPAQALSGRAYLEARREEQHRRDELARSRAEVATRVHEGLLKAAEDGVMLRPQSTEASGHEQEMVLNGAYLVGDRERFEAALIAAARERRGELAFELTGPWPPYNFVPAELGRP